MKQLCYTTLLCLLLAVATQPAAAQQPSTLDYYCQPGSGPFFWRFTDIPIIQDTPGNADSITVVQNILYREAQPWDSATLQKLYMDIYFPDTAKDPLLKRPFILLMFGGGFIDGDRDMMKNYCWEFAKRGFVAATIDYRLGKDTDTPCLNKLTNMPEPYSEEKAQYRAIQDADSALRYIVSKASTYRINKNWIFVGGFSAGAGIANGLVYVSQTEANSSTPGPVTLEMELGKLRGTTNNYTIKGIFNNWGGIGYSFYDAAEAVPMVAFHGTNDKVVPCFLDKKYNDKVPACGQNDSILGSGGLAVALEAAGKCYDVTLFEGAGHGIWPDNTPNAVKRKALTFRIERAACFFKSLMCDDIPCISTNPPLRVAAEDKTDTLAWPYAHCYPNPGLVHMPWPDSKDGLLIHPNPANGYFRINAGPPTMPFTVSLYDNTGRLVKTYQDVNSGSLLPTERLAPGLYLVVARTAPNIIVTRQKLVIK